MSRRIFTKFGCSLFTERYSITFHLQMDTNPDNKNLNIGLNSEDEDYSDLPSCGTTGDPAHKIQFSKAGGKNQSN